MKSQINPRASSPQGRSKVVAAFGRKPLNFRIPSGLAANLVGIFQSAGVARATRPSCRATCPAVCGAAGKLPPATGGSPVISARGVHAASGKLPPATGGLPVLPNQNSAGYGKSRLGIRAAVLLCLLALSPSSRPASVPAKPPVPAAPVHSDLTLLQCGNLIYAGSQSSVCFADNFLTDVANQTNLRVNKKFCPVRLDSEALFDFPFCVMSGNETFSLAQRERDQLRKYLTQGGFLLVSPGCSDEKWDKSFRQEIKVCFPEFPLRTIPMTHPIFSIVNQIPRLTEKHGNAVSLEGLEINGRLVLVYSKDGLNDVAHASGCCCCGGDEVANPARVNVNVFTYAALY